MKQFDVFNGDADGICALQQIRLSNPIKSELITGIKRDIQLVKRVNAKKGDNILVLDISLAKNHKEVKALLEQGCSVQYFDHHMAGTTFTHTNFKNNINTSAETCSSLLVNKYLNNEFSLWAIVGAYGDNMFTAADALAEKKGLNQIEQAQLKELGQFINYNGYGGSLDDLYFHPDALYKLIKPYKNPFNFIKNEPAYNTLKTGFFSDLKKAEKLTSVQLTDKTAVYLLPNEKWARRVSGTFGNQLANQAPDRAHALLTSITGNKYQVSVRAPLNNKIGAGTLCSKFETGGGREGAAGINYLKEQDKEIFLKYFTNQYSH